MSGGRYVEAQLAEPVDVDVLVVGLGPAGGVMAGALARAGHRVAAIDRWPAPYGLPRLSSIDGETARIVQSVGDIDEAMREATVLERAEWYGADGELSMSLLMSGTSSGFAATYSIFQPHIEEAIELRTATFPNAVVMRGTALVGLRQDESGIVATVGGWRGSQEGVDPGSHRTITARYVVGCDGARSTVRALLGVEVDDLGIEERWLNVDAEVKRPLPAKARTVEFHMRPDRPHMWMPIGRTRHRFEIRLHSDEEAAELERPEVAWKWLADLWGLGPDDLTIIRQTVYPFTTRMARTWRAGRAFLAGDSVHTMPPYTGMGACSAMRDAKNLAWKLDLVLRGLAADELLDTYQREREAHYAQLLQVSLHLCQAVNTIDPDAAHARDLAMRGRPPTPTSFPGPKTGFLHHGTDGHVPGVVGDPSPQGVVRRGGETARFDDAVGGGFSMVTAFDPDAVLSGERMARLREIGVAIGSLDPSSRHHVEDVDGTYRAFFDDHAVSAFVARPDFLLYGLADDENKLADLVDELLGGLGTPHVDRAESTPAA